MLRRCISSVSLSAGHKNWEPVSIASCVNTQCVRWRKMRTDPPPKNKVIIKRRPVPNEWEENFLKTRLNHYRTMMRGIKSMVRQEVEYAEARDELLLAKKEEEERIPEVLAWNEQENERTRQERETLLSEEWRQAEEEKIQRLQMHEEEREAHLKQIESMVHVEKEASESFITLDNMEEMIEESIANPKNYNFLLKQDGRVVLPEDTAWKDLKELLQDNKGGNKTDEESEGKTDDKS